SISKLLKLYSQKYREPKSLLNKKCNGTFKAIVTQANTQLGSKIIYDGDRKSSTKVTSKLFSTFVKDSPFLNKTFKTCSVVGNGGVLGNSSCGKNIDLAQFVIRCNLGTLNNGYDKHVGKKTNLISFNPSILTEHYGALIDYRRPFVNRLDLYKDALLLLPTFPYQRDTAVSLCAYYTLNDFDSSIRAVLYNPEYLRNLMTRLSTGIMMVSLGVEMCDDVQVYGFWPFPVHPNDCRPITNRYYDNRPWKRKFHVMPDEFHQLLRLHNMGVLKLHLGRCIPGRE
uniref:ST8 alpha-N-acetyl-neuraminide alpha-2,8-sialyltransferase 6 n=1 Tax=Paramormyrops kingsleyae TaxID=1676925 RepID=A0A3B3QC37_9TELE